jgi:endonuclease III
MRTGSEPGRTAWLPEVLDALESEYGPAPAPPVSDAVGLLLWENVAYLVDDGRRDAALAALDREVGLAPDAILGAPPAVLRAVVAGMRPDERVERLRKVAALALTHLLPEVDQVLSLPLADARRVLRRFPGIGNPSAERILLLTRHHPVLALDSNGLRVLLRLGIGTEAVAYDQSYRSAQAAAQAQLPADIDALIRAHLLLRHHGRRRCRRTAPACPGCPALPWCPWVRQPDSLRP